MNRESTREILAFVLAAFAGFAFLCLYSHDSLDYLEGDGTIQNFCGPVGAALGFHLTRWFGKAGAYGAIAFLALWGIFLFFRKQIRQWGWKLLGAALFVLTLCALEGAVFDGSRRASILPGGYFGWSFYTFLLAHLSTVGTYFLLGLAALIAFLISTDTVLYPAVARSQQILFDAGRWGGALGRKLKQAAPAAPRLHLGAALRRALGGLRSLPSRPKPAGPPAPEGSRSRPSGRRRVSDLTDPLELKVRGAGVEEESEEEDVDEPPADLEAEVPGAGEETGAETATDSEVPEAEEEAEEEPESETPAPGAEGGAEEEAAGGEAPEAGAPSFKIHEPPPDPVNRKGISSSPAPRRKEGPYHLPPLSLIESLGHASQALDHGALAKTASKIETTLRDFKIEARVVEVQTGPTITQFEISLAAGIKVHKIVNLADDLAMALKAQSIRIIAPIPGKSTVGIEVPNKSRSMVGLRKLIETIQERDKEYRLPMALGRDTAGAPVISDLGEMPHLLIAGSTGSGKSVCINSIICSILLTRSPEEVKLILVDPKMVELAQFENLPHLLCPVVTDMKKAPAVLNWLVDKMEERYELLAMAGVRHITSYNALGREKLRERLLGKIDEEEIEQVPEYLPFVVLIMDELADLMMSAAKEVEASITRLSQKSRAVGIHVILATQRPSVDVITGLIKANMPSRISFRVTSKVDSRTILDRNGADKLLGKGDMLYIPPGTSDLIRVQGAYIPDKDIRNVVQFAAREADPQFNSELTRFGLEGIQDTEVEDELYEEAVRIVLESRRGSVTLLQRQLQIGYTRASRLMELMHEKGLVGPFKGSKAREVYYTLEDWEKSQKRKQ
ncbi:MAG: DNA translocase FtsK [Planctomycetes bacterium]|nr:DNA translocase FtsK [Planctomycetota bacterium]